MSSGLIVALELALVVGGMLALAVWELWRLRRGRSRDFGRTRALESDLVVENHPTHLASEKESSRTCFDETSSVSARGSALPPEP
jgi:hypothetical protein